MSVTEQRCLADDRLGEDAKHIGDAPVDDGERRRSQIGEAGKGFIVRLVAVIFLPKAEMRVGDGVAKVLFDLLRLTCLPPERREFLLDRKGGGMSS